MTRLRRLFHVCPGIAATIVALALAMKLLVPAGFMPVIVDGRVVVSICSGTAPAQTMAMAMPGMSDMPDMAHHMPEAPPKHDEGASAPCAFAGLMAASLAAADPLLLSIAILVAMTLAFRLPSRPLVHAPVRWRPPLRGPPRSA